MLPGDELAFCAIAGRALLLVGSFTFVHANNGQRNGKTTLCVRESAHFLIIV